MSLDEKKTANEKQAEFEDHQHVDVAEELSPELEALLQTEPLKGLASSEVEERTAKFGKNEISEKKTNPILKFLSYFTGAIAYLIELAFILSGVERIAVQERVHTNVTRVRAVSKSIYAVSAFQKAARRELPR
ncbi:hypothetical protein H4R24_004777 [Coemansia sp. RSA 988]|nr:hypothetical protein H4R24_004777 [Coemansia sp. RSA 988]